MADVRLKYVQRAGRELLGVRERGRPCAQLAGAGVGADEQHPDRRDGVPGLDAELVEFVEAPRDGLGFVDARLAAEEDPVGGEHCHAGERGDGAGGVDQCDVGGLVELHQELIEGVEATGRGDIGGEGEEAL